VDVGKTLRAKTRAEWRRWLARNHDRRPEIWLVFHTKASGKRFVAYDDAVEEALCFGWSDSTVKKLDGDARAQRFTPRRPGSAVSELNRERVRRLVAQGLMTPAGLAAIGAAGRPAGRARGRFVVPADIRRELKRDRETWGNFQAFPETYRRIRVAWIDAARVRPEVFEQRLRYFLRMTKQNKRFGTYRDDSA
jgi:uncharacterized protein YdeI (YjbR/CyaY-like superfamily)